MQNSWLFERPETLSLTWFYFFTHCTLLEKKIARNQYLSSQLFPSSLEMVGVGLIRRGRGRGRVEPATSSLFPGVSPTVPHESVPPILGYSPSGSQNPQLLPRPWRSPGESQCQISAFSSYDPKILKNRPEAGGLWATLCSWIVMLPCPIALPGFRDLKNYSKEAAVFGDIKNSVVSIYWQSFS